MPSIFSKKQIDYNSGGPKDINLLYDPLELKKDFPGMDFEIFNEEKKRVSGREFPQRRIVCSKYIRKKTISPLI